MNKKGFTLVELLGVLIVLAIISTIVIISIGGLLKKSEESLSDTQKRQIESAAKLYHLKEGMSSNATCVSVGTLLSKGYLEGAEIKDPKTDQKMTGFVRINYESNKYTYTYEEESCVATLVSGTKGEYGSKYSVKVNSNDTFYFYLIGTNPDGTVNLILDRNICSDGTLTDNVKADKCLVAWASKADYVAAGGLESDYGENGNSSKGPITAIEYLRKATKKWANINYDYPDYDDEYGNFQDFSLEGLHARLPYKSEAGNATSNDSNKFLYEYLRNYSSWDSSVYGTTPINNINGINGYWLFCGSQTNTARMIYYQGVIDGNLVSNISDSGIRPVITIEL